MADSIESVLCRFLFVVYQSTYAEHTRTVACVYVCVRVARVFNFYEYVYFDLIGLNKFVLLFLFHCRWLF